MEVTFTQESDNRKHVSETDHILYVGGKTPNTKNLWNDDLDLEVDENGYIAVDDKMQTSVSSIYAAGDVVGNPFLCCRIFCTGQNGILQHVRYAQRFTFGRNSIRNLFPFRKYRPSD